MARPRLRSGEVASVLPLGEGLRDARTTALLKGTQLEVVRVVLPAGKGLPEHSAPGEITVQCIEGEVEFVTREAVHVLAPGDFLHLACADPHSLRARKDASLLVTICLAKV